MENTSDSFMPGPLLFCMKIERSVCYKVTDNRMGIYKASKTEINDVLFRIPSNHYFST